MSHGCRGLIRLDSLGKDGISTRALFVFLGEDLEEMGICGFIFTICESPPADPSCVELAQNCSSLWPALQEVPHSLLEWLS